MISDSDVQVAIATHGYAKLLMCDSLARVKANLVHTSHFITLITIYES